MKTIYLKRIATQQTNYTILLGNGSRVNYTSKRAYLYAIAALQREMTRLFVELNEIYILLYTEYRRAWLVTHNHITGLNYKTEYSVKNNLEAAVSKLDHIYFKKEHDSFILGIEIKKITMFLRIACQALEDFYNKKNAVINYYSVLTLNKRLLFILESINYSGFVTNMP